MPICPDDEETSQKISTICLSGRRFTSLSLAPDAPKIAFSVNGSVHDWSGIFFLNSGIMQEDYFSYGGDIKKVSWNPNPRYKLLLVEEIPASGIPRIVFYNPEESKKEDLKPPNDFLSARNKLVEFYDRGFGVYDAKWSDDGKKIFFTTRFMFELKEEFPQSSMVITPNELEKKFVIDLESGDLSPIP
jgi:Tol biopolymer transport system component